MIVGILLLPKLTMAASIALDVTSSNNCSRIIGEFHHHFGNDESGFFKSDPETSLYFGQNSGNYTMDVNGQSKNYFKLLEPKLSTVSSSSNLANYDNYCTSACSVYLQKSSDHGRTPASIAGGFDCSSDFEAIGSATNSYATSNFQWSSADHTLKFIPDSTALTTYICYVCVATPTDATAAATSSNIQTKKTEAIKIEVGDCAANPPTVTNSGWRLIK